MRKKLLLTFVVLSMMLVSFSASAGAASSSDDRDLSEMPTQAGLQDDVEHPLGVEQRDRKARAMEQVANGKVRGAVVEVARGQFVELEREDEDLIWTVTGEFGSMDSPVKILKSGVTGPLHNEIPEPDRTVDNTTIWTDDFSEQYYEDLLFDVSSGANSMANWYTENSSNRYSVDGDVTDWSKVKFNAAHYGRDWCGGIVCSNTWWFVEDSVNAWFDSQMAAGMTVSEINDYLSQFDVWDRYDFDGDGNFDEPDGYIDHFQSVHAGEGQEAGGGAQGADAIWSHRWYAFFNNIGVEGPSPDYLLGGIQVGRSNYWIGDYTIEPENGGVGVFAHEFAHDLGLPDLYDTSGNTGGAENSTGFWTIMSSGSWLNNGTDDIGSRPGHFGAWEKFQLGWLNYDVAVAGATSQHKLGPSETNSTEAQGLFVVLPDKEVTEVIADPYEGDYFYYSGAGNDIDNSMTKAFTLPAGASLSAKANVDIELDWDYAYLMISTDGGTTWTNVETSLSTTSDPNGQNFGFGITGATGGWVDMTADLSAWEGEVQLGFRYWTDGAVVNPGLMVDNLEVSGSDLDGGEVDAGWTFDGFSVTTGTETNFYFNAYVAEFKQYWGYDEGLQTGPYNFGFLDDPLLGSYVEHFPYQDGLLISYWDSSQADNSVGDHPGSGLILPIDAHPEVMHRGDGGIWRNRVQSYDSTFGVQPTDAITLHWLSVASSHPSLPAARIFNDNKQYWRADNPTGGVINPHTGTLIRVKGVTNGGTFMRVEVKPAP